MIDPILPELRQAASECTGALKEGRTPNVAEVQRRMHLSGDDADRFVSAMLLKGRKQLCKAYDDQIQFANDILKVHSAEKPTYTMDQDEATIVLIQDVAFVEKNLAGLDEDAYLPFKRKRSVRIYFEPHTALIRHIYCQYFQNKLLLEVMGFTQKDSAHILAVGRTAKSAKGTARAALAKGIA